MGKTAKQPKPCIRQIKIGEDEDGDDILQPCPYFAWQNFRMCKWHKLIELPTETQVQYAHRRLELYQGERRARVPASECPPGERWCSGCQTFVPLFYAQGSRCRACNGEASHAGHVQREYDLDPAKYRRLLEWQGGRCAICRRKTMKRLAVDHDHITLEVRGLVCADNEYGCNVRLLGAIEARSTALATARNLVRYLEMPPLARMRRGQEPDWAHGGPQEPDAGSEAVRAAQQTSPAPSQAGPDWGSDWQF